MTRSHYLNYWTLPTGSVVVYSADEKFVISGQKKEVTLVVRMMAQRIRERGLKAMENQTS